MRPVQMLLAFPVALAGLALAAERFKFTHIDLTPYLNNKAAAPTGQLAGFNDGKEAYPVEFLPTGIIHDGGFSYQLPDFNSARPDNINCSAQTVNVPPARYHALGWLGASDGYHATINAQITALYTDGTNETLGFIVDPFYGIYPSIGPIGAPGLTSQHQDGTVYYNTNMSSIFSFQHALDNAKVLKSLILPSQTATSTYFGKARVHMFALSLTSSAADNTSQAILNIHNVRSTTKFRTNGTQRVQLVEVTLSNLAPRTQGPEVWITEDHTVELMSDAVETVIPVTFKRLRGGDQIRVVIGIVNSPNISPGTSITASVVVKNADGQLALDPPPTANITAGIPDYNNDDTSLRTHEAPEWFDGAKFGLFVHWGVYSVPAWTVSGTQYAEWYNFWLHSPANESSAVWKHHKQVWGEDFVYDDFIPLFKAEHWNATEFVQFVADIGAKYYVFTTKHHEGFALFDTGSSSNRNSLKYGPKRDLIGELVNATKTTQPQLYSGLYFSLPEWYNPAYVEYANDAGSNGQYSRRGKSGTVGYDILQRTAFPGGPAQNAYNASKIDPFTGYVEVEDFVQDIQKPQMQALLYSYGADILWCDIGVATAYPELAADWYNSAMANGRQVSVNARCGTNYSDFDTPEYSKSTSLKTRKWESSEGSDPYSYGFNQDTPPQNYRNATYLIQSLVDIVSKNGNYLIDIGPMANGTIHDSSRTSLLEVGKWLKYSGEAIYNTQYWFIKAQEGDLRFTTTPTAFYITSLSRPVNGTLRSTSPVPIKDGDRATFLGPRGESEPLLWRWTSGDVLEVKVDDEILADTKYAWSFKFHYL